MGTGGGGGREEGIGEPSVVLGALPYVFGAGTTGIDECIRSFLFLRFLVMGFRLLFLPWFRGENAVMDVM